jgi:ABC-2 type transport system permease protein
MTVFKTFWKIVNKYKGTIILYTVMLISFGGINLVSNDTTTIFTSTLPNIAIVNNDQKSVLTNNLISYLSENSKVVDIENDEEKINDALFYRDVSYVVYIPKNYTNDVLKGMNPTIDIKSTNDYTSSLEEMMLTDYLNLQNTYLKLTTDQAKLTNYINDTLKDKSEVVLTSKVDTKSLSKVSRYFNFASYSILAVVIFIITLVLTSFKEKTVNKRIVVSSMNYKKHSGLILKSSLLYALIVWVLFSLLAIILLGKSLLNIRGLLLLLNTLIFTLQALTFALLISSLVNNKDAIGGIVNVVALGSAFLCGAFIPSMYLPEKVVSISHIFPAYYYNNSNDLVTSLEVINLTTLKPFITNIMMMLVFMLVFIVLNNFVIKNKRKA